MEVRIPLSDLDYGVEEENAVLDVLRSRWLTMGAVTQEFEKDFADLVGAKHAFAVSNCTQALHLACLALGIGQGDKVILPALTFVATANAVLYTGAQVQFADVISFSDFSVSPAEIERQITPGTKAIIVVHYGGYPCPMVEIADIAKRHRLAIIEDAAHAPGASLNGSALGAWGDIGCFSFFSNKNLAVGEGGMLVTNRDDVAQAVKLLRSHGMTTLTLDRHRGHAHSYDVVALGYNYRIDEIHSALGLAQLRKLKRNNARRRELTEQYRTMLSSKGFEGVEIPFSESQGQPSFHLFPILLPENIDRRAFMDAMRNDGVQTSIHYPPIHHFDYYRHRYPDVSLPLTEKIASREVTLPLYPRMSDDDVEYVASVLRKNLLSSGTHY